MRALSVIPTLGVASGGPGVNLVRSVPHLAAVGVKLDILTTDMATPSASGSFRRLQAEDFPEGSDRCEISIVRSRAPHRVNFAPGMHRAANKHMATTDAARLHGMYLYPHLAAALALWRARKPYFVSPHGILDPYIRDRTRHAKWLFDAVWQERVLRRAAFVHATTDSEAQDIDDAFPGLRIRVVGNGLSFPEPAGQEAAAKFRAELLGGWTGPIVTTLGRISHKKGLDVLIAAFATVQKMTGARLVIIGSDEERLVPELRRQAHSLGIDEHVSFTGPLHGDLQQAALAATDVWALPSKGENFGNAVAEAMAAGLPVVISPEVGLASLVALEDAGSVVKATEGEFGRAIGALLTDAPRRAIAGENARRAAQAFEWTHIAPQMRDLFSECIRASPAKLQ